MVRVSAHATMPACTHSDSDVTACQASARCYASARCLDTHGSGPRPSRFMLMLMLQILNGGSYVLSTATNTTNLRKALETVLPTCKDAARVPTALHAPSSYVCPSADVVIARAWPCICCLPSAPGFHHFLPVMGFIWVRVLCVHALAVFTHDVWIPRTSARACIRGLRTQVCLPTRMCNICLARSFQRRHGRQNNC